MYVTEAEMKAIRDYVEELRDRVLCEITEELQRPSHSRVEALNHLTKFIREWSSCDGLVQPKKDG
jgi:hypothetical protein